MSNEINTSTPDAINGSTAESAPPSLLASASEADLALLEAFLRFRSQGGAREEARNDPAPRSPRGQPPPPPTETVEAIPPPCRQTTEATNDQNGAEPPMPQRGQGRGRGRPFRGRGRGRGRWTPYPQQGGGHRCSYHRRVDCRNCASLSHADRPPGSCSA